MNVKIQAFFNVYSGGTAYNPQFAFWNLSDSFSEIWGSCAVNAGQTIDNNLIGVCTLTLGKSYTLDFGNGGTFAGQQVRSFGLIIEEVVGNSTDTFSWDDNTLKQLMLANVNVGGSTSTGIRFENQNNTDNAEITLNPGNVQFNFNGSAYKIINSNSETNYQQFNIFQNSQTYPLEQITL